MGFKSLVTDYNLDGKKKRYNLLYGENFLNSNWALRHGERYNFWLITVMTNCFANECYTLKVP